MVALSELLSQVSANWKHDPERYPAMLGMYRTEKLEYMLGHAGLHMTKSVVPLTVDLLMLLAEVATDSERAQHVLANMTPERRAQWKERVAKLLATTLGLAVIMGMNADELEQLVSEILAANN
jgi:hypothetical protein